MAGHFQLFRLIAPCFCFAIFGGDLYQVGWSVVAYRFRYAGQFPVQDKRPLHVVGEGVDHASAGCSQFVGQSQEGSVFVSMYFVRDPYDRPFASFSFLFKVCIR